ncbi:MAG TPA: CPBP family intramembrane glutamic endopeptidase [Gemmatimonadaceae bacterium]|nr:CPBP family intramembrane glutamic endopeptidase [Gemmatimonadaceae bacterium]
MSVNAHIAEATVFQLPALPAARAAGRAPWWWLTALVALAWLGSTGFLAAYRETEVARLLTMLVPGRALFLASMASASVLAGIAWRRRERRLAGAAAMIVAFLLGHLLYEAVYPLLGARLAIPFPAPAAARDFAAARLAWGASIGAACLVAWWLTSGWQAGAPALALGHGDWSVRGRDFSKRDAPHSWARRLGTGYLGFMVVLFVAMQANVGFAPLRSGALVSFLPAILLAAVTNAAAEELVFRGLIQPAFIRFGGVAAGLWMQGLLFGLMHWHNSVGLLAALPVSLLLGLGAVVWGKAAYETHGLTWVIVAHALVDVAVMGAFFVPGTNS